MPTDTVTDPLYWAEVIPIPNDGEGEVDNGTLAAHFAVQSVAHELIWRKALDQLFKDPTNPVVQVALRWAHDRHFEAACTAFAAAAGLHGWDAKAIRNALEMGDAWEHVYEWFWEGIGKPSNEEADALLARLVVERPEPAEVTE